jgi:hypothetical protein
MRKMIIMVVNTQILQYKISLKSRMVMKLLRKFFCGHENLQSEAVSTLFMVYLSTPSVVQNI